MREKVSRSTFKSGILSIFVLWTDCNLKGGKEGVGGFLDSRLSAQSLGSTLSMARGTSQRREREDALISEPGCTLDGSAPREQQI